MGHLVPAARKLSEEILDVEPKATITQPEDPDGLGYVRSIRVEGAAAKRLSDALDVVADDDRIAEVVRSSAGTRVTFVADTRADYAQTFDLAEAVAGFED